MRMEMGMGMGMGMGMEMEMAKISSYLSNISLSPTFNESNVLGNANTIDVATSFKVIECIHHKRKLGKVIWTCKRKAAIVMAMLIATVMVMVMVIVMVIVIAMASIAGNGNVDAKPYQTSGL